MLFSALLPLLNPFHLETASSNGSDKCGVIPGLGSSSLQKSAFSLHSGSANPCLHKKLAPFSPIRFPVFVTPFQLTVCRVMLGLCTKVSQNVIFCQNHAESVNTVNEQFFRYLQYQPGRQGSLQCAREVSQYTGAVWPATGGVCDGSLPGCLSPERVVRKRGQIERPERFR